MLWIDTRPTTVPAQHKEPITMRLRPTGLMATMSVLTLGVFAAGAHANAQLKDSVTGVAIPNGTAVKLRSASNITFSFNSGGGIGSGGVITCRHPYAALGDASVTNNSITGLQTAGTWSSTGSISKLFFGDLMPVTATGGTPCGTTIPGITPCTLVVSNIPLAIDAQINNPANPDQGINARVYKSLGPPIVPVQLTVTCTSSGTPITCVYRGGTTSTAPAATLANAPYSTTAPIEAGTLTFTNQPFYRDTSQSAGICPATTSSSPLVFNGSFQLFTTGGNRIHAYKVSDK